MARRSTTAVAPAAGRARTCATCRIRSPGGSRRWRSRRRRRPPPATMAPTAMAHQLASTVRRPAPAPASGDRTSGGRRRLRRSRSSRPACARWKWFHRPRPPRRPCLGAPVSSLGPATRARAALTRGDNGSNGGQIREYSDEEDPLLARLKRKRERHEAKEAHKGEAAAGGDGGRGHGAAAPRERLTVADMAGE
jgi:hypothetical protein